MGVHTSGGTNERDEGNGEGFLSIMNAFTDWYLFSKFENKTQLSHILHCILEFQYMYRYIELAYYEHMLKLYSETKKKKRKRGRDD